MTTDQGGTRLPVVVAVSGDGSDAGIRFAAGEAVRDGGPLHVVHVVQLPAAVGTGPGATAQDASARAERICAGAVEHARRIVGHEVAVTSEIFHGDLVEGLLEIGRDARCLVLQRHAPGAPRTDPRATSLKVSSRASVPVVCVPRDWRGRGVGTVTVGVSEPRTCASLLREALLVAWSRDARLRILHVSWDADVGDVRRELEAALSVAGQDLHAVETSIEVVSGGVAGAVLVETMETSELLVLGRHHPLVPHGSRLGPVARRVVREAACPVLLLTPAASTSDAAWVFAGHLA